MADPIAFRDTDELTYLERLSKEFNGPTDSLRKRMDAALDAVKGDTTNSSYMAEFQAAMAAYTTLRAAQSGTIKTLKDAEQSIISKF